MTSDSASTDSSTLPITVSAQFTVTCKELDTEPARHRILVHRDGKVSCPDHTSPVEAVMKALGGNINNTCSYWQAVGDAVPFTPGNALTDQAGPPEMMSWQYDGIVTTWTNQARTTAIAAILGRTYQGSLDPEKALPLQQTFIKNDQLSSDSRNLISQLITPQERPSGYRRPRATTPEELNDLLSLGFGARTAVDLACLDFDKTAAKKALKEVSRLRLPADMIPHLGQVFTPTQTVQILSHLDRATAALQISRLAGLLDPSTDYTLEDAAKEIVLPEDEYIASLGTI